MEDPSTIPKQLSLADRAHPRSLPDDTVAACLLRRRRQGAPNNLLGDPVKSVGGEPILLVRQIPGIDMSIDLMACRAVAVGRGAWGYQSVHKETSLGFTC